MPKLTETERRELIRELAEKVMGWTSVHEKHAPHCGCAMVYDQRQETLGMRFIGPACGMTVHSRKDRWDPTVRLRTKQKRNWSDGQPECHLACRPRPCCAAEGTAEMSDLIKKVADNPWAFLGLVIGVCFLSNCLERDALELAKRQISEHNSTIIEPTEECGCRQCLIASGPDRHFRQAGAGESSNQKCAT